MKKIKDRNTLAIVSGMIGLVGLMVIDVPLHIAGISKRSYREASAGMFVSKSEAKTFRGHILGFIMNSAVSI